MPWIVLTASSEPSGINSAAVLSRAVLNEARRRLPEIPTSFVMMLPANEQCYKGLCRLPFRDLVPTLKLNTGLRLEPSREMMLHRPHFGHAIGHCDEFRLCVPARDDSGEVWAPAAQRFNHLANG